MEQKLFNIYRELIEVYERQQYEQKSHEEALRDINDLIKPLSQHDNPFRRQDNSYNVKHICVSSAIGTAMGMFSAFLLLAYQRRNRMFKAK